MAGYGTKESDIRVWQTGCESVSASAFKVGEGLRVDRGGRGKGGCARGDVRSVLLM